MNTFQSKDDEASLSGLSFSQNSLGGSKNRIQHKSHLFKLKTHYTPAICCVCNSSIRSGFARTVAYNCEACGLDCCADCRLQVDVEFPCGSDLASKAIAESIQTKLSTHSILSVVAPMNESSERALDPDYVSSAKKGHSMLTREITEPLGEAAGIGTMKVKFVQAAAFKNPLSSLADLSLEDQRTSQELIEGDYYLRITRTGISESARTSTVQRSSQPQFDESMEFDM